MQAGCTAVLTAVTCLLEAAVPLNPSEELKSAGEHVFTNVTGVACTEDGRIFAACGRTEPILVLDARHRLLGGFGAGIIRGKHGIRRFGNSLYITDTENHTVFEFSLGGALIRTLGTTGRPGCDERTFHMPTDVAMAPDGELYIADGYGNQRIVRLAADGRFLGAWGSKGSGNGEFKIPHNLVFDAHGRLYVADRGNGRIQIFERNGAFIGAFATEGEPFTLESLPDDTLLVGFAGSGQHGFARYAIPDGKCLGIFGEKGDGRGEIITPHAISRNPATGEWIAGGAGDAKLMFLPPETFQTENKKENE